MVRFRLLMAVLLAVIAPTCALFDLYIPKSAMQQVIKTFKDSKVYYVYNGTVNRYALRFKIPIPMHVDKLHFCWINRSKQKMPYSIGFSVSNQLAMATPQLNISSRGTVPHHVSGFEVTLPCTGAVQSEVSFAIKINVTVAGRANSTSLTILRSKVCSRQRPGLRQLGDNLDRRPQAPGDDSPPADDIAEEADSPSSTQTFVILGGASAVSLALIGTLAAVYFFRARRAAAGVPVGGGGGQFLHSWGAAQPPPGGHSIATASAKASQCWYYLQARGQQPQPQHQQQQLLLGNNNSYSKVETCSQTSGYTSCSLPSHQRANGSPATAEPTDLLQDLRVPWERITLKCILMEGNYGRVYRASMRSTCSGRDHQLMEADAVDDSEQQEVLIKTVSDTARADQTNEFLQQASAMVDLQHRNISQALAAAQIPGDPRPHLVYAFPTEGNLKFYLQRCRAAQATSAYCVLSTQQLIGMATHIAKGLHYIHRRRLVHGDVACRNCVLTGDYTVKLSDAALSRDLFPDDYQCLHGYGSRPLRWMSPEALIDGRFTTATDVWAFGVTLWELITRCLVPYAEIDTAQLPRHLVEGNQLSRPMNCPDQLYSIMSQCWHTDPEQRSKLSQVLADIGDFNAALRSYV